MPTVPSAESEVVFCSSHGGSAQPELTSPRLRGGCHKELVAQRPSERHKKCTQKARLLSQFTLSSLLRKSMLTILYTQAVRPAPFCKRTTAEVLVALSVVCPASHRPSAAAALITGLDCYPRWHLSARKAPGELPSRASVTDVNPQTCKNNVAVNRRRRNVVMDAILQQRCSVYVLCSRSRRGVSVPSFRVRSAASRLLSCFESHRARRAKPPSLSACQTHGVIGCRGAARQSDQRTPAGAKIGFSRAVQSLPASRASLTTTASRARLHLCFPIRAQGGGGEELQLCRDPTATSVGAEYARPLGYGVALPEHLTQGEFNVYR